MGYLFAIAKGCRSSRLVYTTMMRSVISNVADGEQLMRAVCSVVEFQSSSNGDVVATDHTIVDPTTHVMASTLDIV